MSSHSSISSHTLLMFSHSSLWVTLATDRVVTWTRLRIFCLIQGVNSVVSLSTAAVTEGWSHRKPPSAGDLESVFLLPFNLPYFAEDSWNFSNSWIMVSSVLNLSAQGHVKLTYCYVSTSLLHLATVVYNRVTWTVAGMGGLDRPLIQQTFEQLLECCD
jgi:hypothetical protein